MSARLGLAIALLLLSGCRRRELEGALLATQTQLEQARQAIEAERKARADVDRQRATTQQQLDETTRALRALETQNADLAAEHGTTATELAALRADKQAREQELRGYRDLLARLKSLVDAGTIEVSLRKGRMVVKLASAVLFDSATTALKPAGEAALRALVPALASLPDREFLVAGHTDNIPIKSPHFRSNWELSTARAVEVVRFMIDAGYPAARVGAAGFGAFDPIDTNDTEEGRSRNRRIEIILMPNLGELPELGSLVAPSAAPPQASAPPGSS